MAHVTSTCRFTPLSGGGEIAGRLISISGPPGAGKTSLARALAERLGATLVEFDRFEQMTRLPPDKVREWIAQGADYGAIPTPGLAEAVWRALASGDVVLDTPLGRADPGLGPQVSFSVWLDIPAETALLRKLSQFASSVPAGQEPGFVHWLRGYLQNYAVVVQPSTDTQRQRVRPLADLSLEATRPIADLVEEIVRRESL